MYPFLSINILRSWQPIILLFLDHCCASLGEYFTMVFTTPQRIKIVSFYLETRSVVQTQRRYRNHFHTREAPTPKTILRLVRKLNEHGNLLNLNKGNSGRRRTARTQDNIEAVRQSVNQSPKKGYRRRAQELELRSTSVRRILKEELKMYPYKIQVRHALTDRDKAERVEMCNFFNRKMECDNDWIQNVWFSDEAHFHLNGSVNRQNVRYWGSIRPHDVLEVPLHSPKCTAWCAMSAKGIIGPLWFVDDNERTVTINKERYQNVIRMFHAELTRSADINSQWFQQDGATPHTANTSMQLLQQLFDDRVISKRSRFPWAPRSPDLNPLDFFLWGYTKDNVYAEHPNTICQLKRRIEEFIHGIPMEMCARVIQNFGFRLNRCLGLAGGHVENVVLNR